MNAEPSRGKVYLVGAGPGDPGLMTVRGLECLAEADVVIYDYLANPEFLAQARRAREKIYVGKKGAQHALEQDDINELIATKAREGNIVVRLKGGDPFVFGRGGEEALVLAREGIPFEIVPGITSGIAAPAYAGIPVTHRTCTSSVTFITGHEDPTKPESAIDWAALGAGSGTLVFFMGIKNLPNLAAKLIEQGRTPGTPVAVIRRGTFPDQQVVEGTLDTIAERTQAAGLKPPAITVIGEVASLRSSLAWFDRLPLFGKTIVVTRTRTQASRVAKDLGRLGARVLLFPTIRIAPPEDAAPLRAGLDGLGEYDWTVFTSVNAVDAVFRDLQAKGLDARAFGGGKICSIGPATGQRLRENGILADLVPPTYTTDAIFDALAAVEPDLGGKRIFLPRAAIANPELPRRLNAAGAETIEAVAYRTVPADPEPDVIAALREGTVDIVTFTSSSTAKNFASLVSAELGRLPGNVRYASIGPETTRAAEAAGMPIGIEATTYTIPGLVEALVAHSREQR